MIAARLSALLQRHGVHYGWVVVGVTFLTMLVTAGAVGAPGVLILPLQHEFGWQTEQISTALAIRLVLFGLMGPFAAAFLNRFGLKRVAFTALSLILFGLAGSLVMTQVWQLIALWGVTIGIATGLTAVVLGATVASRWFSHRRGLVVGMLTASSATGQLVFLPLLAGLTERYGWRMAIGFVAAMTLLAVVVLLLLMADRPSVVGLLPYGDTAATAPPDTRGATSPIAALREAAGSRTFWVLFASFFVCGASTNGLIQTHFVSLCGDYGIAAVGAASMLAVMGVFDFVGTIGSGWLSDKVDNRALLFWYYGLRGLSLVYLPFSNFSFYGLSIFAVFYGLDWIATVPPTVRLISQHFGRERANLVFGWVFAGHQLGAATAAFGAGYTRTAYATYLPAFFAAGVMCLGAALLVLTIGRAQPRRVPVVA
jgi:predicted MFS family arabinose efflux permease